MLIDWWHLLIINCFCQRLRQINSKLRFHCSGPWISCGAQQDSGTLVPPSGRNYLLHPGLIMLMRRRAVCACVCINLCDGDKVTLSIVVFAKLSDDLYYTHKSSHSLLSVLLTVYQHSIFKKTLKSLIYLFTMKTLYSSCCIISLKRNRTVKMKQYRLKLLSYPLRYAFCSDTEWLFN